MANILKNLVLLFLWTSSLYSKDIGVHGHLFPITETNLLEYLRNRIEQMTSEEIQLINQNIKNNFLRLIEEPKPIPALTESREYKVYYYDPTVVLDNDIVDNNGNIIVAKGRSVNPLEIQPLTKQLLFFDGNKESHIAWVKRQNKEAKWILVRGRPLELENAEDHPVFFDQFGYLVNKFGIQRVPARVSQEDLQLKIEEIPMVIK